MEGKLSSKADDTSTKVAVFPAEDVLGPPKASSKGDEAVRAALGAVDPPNADEAAVLSWLGPPKASSKALAKDGVGAEKAGPP